jgi:L-asparaginase II
MLAAAVKLGLEPRGYEQPDHPLQVMIARIISETCCVTLDRAHVGVDGCSVPTWALPLSALARGFARLGTGDGLPPQRASALHRLVAACSGSPVFVAGEGRFDTVVMAALGPAVFVKGGAEGMHCAALPELGLGIALKIDDGAKRATERALSGVLVALVPEAEQMMAAQLEGELLNWRGISVGRVLASEALVRATAALDDSPRRRAGAVAQSTR